MVTKDLKIISDIGLHARSAAMASYIASQYSKCSVYFNFNDRRVNMKSLLGILSVNVKKDDVINVQCSGEGEDRIIENITTEMIANNIATNFQADPA